MQRRFFRFFLLEAAMVPFPLPVLWDPSTKRAVEDAGPYKKSEM